MIIIGKTLRPRAKPLTKEERERLSRKRDKIKYVDVRFENRHVVGLWGGRGR